LLCSPSGVFAADLFGDILFDGSRRFAARDGSKILAPLNAPAAAKPQDVKTPGVSASGFISLWSQDCSAGQCGLPQPLVPAREVAFEMVLPDMPGQARRKEITEDFTVAGLGELKVKLVFYAICPYGAAEGCPSRYFQVQAELSGAASAFCAASLNAGDFLPMPVFMCAGVPTPGKRLGITLHRI